MNQKILVALTIIAIILGVLNMTLLLIPNLTNTLPFQSTPPDTAQKIPLEVSYAIKNSSEYYVIRVHVSLPDEVQTLFNCYIQVDYLTKNDTWKTVSRNIGIVYYCQDPPINQNLRLDGDFMSDQNITHDAYFQKYEESNIKVEAYGYLKP